MNALAEYQNERLFFTQILGNNSPSNRFFHLKPFSSGFKIAEVATAHGPSAKWIRMKLDQQDKELNIFAVIMA